MNLVVGDNPLAVTHVDAVRVVLDFVFKYHPEEVIIAEASGNVKKRFGYGELEKGCPVRLVDLNDGEFEELKLLTSKMKGTTCMLSQNISGA